MALGDLEFCESWQTFKASAIGVDSADPTNGALVLARWTDLINARVTWFSDSFGIYAGVGANAFLFKTMSHQGSVTIGIRFRAFGPTQLWTGWNNNDGLSNVTVNTDGTLTVHAGLSGVGNPLVGTTDFAIHFGKWNYLELETVLSGSAPIHAHMKLRLNGQLLLDAGADTLHNASGLTSGTATINRHSLTGACDYRDVYFNKTANSFRGDIKIIGRRPDGDVITDWTPTGGGTSFDQINEQYSDFDTTRITSPTPGDQAIFDWQDIPGFSGTIQAVQISVLAKKDDEGLRTIKIVTGDTGTEATSDEIFLSDDYVVYHTPQDVDPATGLAYTQAGYNAKRYGVEVIQ